MGGDMVDFDPLGGVGDLFVVEDEARWIGAKKRC